ncbi:MAG TPA: YciI family protein [Candidatus Acidoferrum sp.]|nr:YciI family protein [Candidatus Acidoferrum sp.]
MRLIPPRPTFPMDITPDEKLLMQEHARYTREIFDAGKILIYGPVMGREGAFGMAVFEMPEEADVRLVLENDPTVRAGLNTFEIHPMRVGAAQGFGPEQNQ